MNTRKLFTLAVGIGWLLTASSVAVNAQPCVVTDDGSGTVKLPPAGCGYLSPNDVHMIIAGLPVTVPPTTIEVAVEHERFFCKSCVGGTNPGQQCTVDAECPGGGTCQIQIPLCSIQQPLDKCEQSGGLLGGEKECSESTLMLNMQGTGSLSTFTRNIPLRVEFETQVGPRTPGQPVQSFDTDMFRLSGQISNIGDPDFDLLRIVAGTGFSMPSPGHTTLTRMGLPGSNWAVDSFFDITYRIDFIGAPGGSLAGHSGSTTATIRMQTPVEPCCLPNGSCQSMNASLCTFSGGTVVSHCPGLGTCVPPGPDCFTTACGRTLFDFCNDPIPADFFGPGSLPFTGEVRLGGTNDGVPDTTVARRSAMLLDGPPETIPIELVQLNLVSCSPITVMIGTQTTRWNVAVDLSPTPVLQGSMTVRKTHANGGVFNADFYVQPRFTFTQVGTSNVRVLDTGAEGMPPELLMTVDGEPWVHQLSPTIQHTPCGVNFVPGVEQNPQTLEQCCTETCHANPGGGHDHCTKQCDVCPRGACCNPQNGTCLVVQGAAACPGQYKGDGTNCNDSDGDGIPDWFENNDCCQPSSPCNMATSPNDPDTDGDGVLDSAELALGCNPCVPDCGGASVPCCLPLGACVNTSSVAACTGQGGTPLPAGSFCQGDNNGDGIDDACWVPPCDECGPGQHWIDNPACPPGGSGSDTVPSGAVLGIDLNLDANCIADTNVVAGGPVTIKKTGPVNCATNYPTVCGAPSHPNDVIDTEIVAMSLTGGGVKLKAGTLSGSNQPLAATNGAIAEQSGNPSLADSFFDVFFEIDMSGNGSGPFVYNQTPVRVAQVIDCVPPKGNYFHLSGCLPLYTSPVPGQGIHVANLTAANHYTYPACCNPSTGVCTPNVSVDKCKQLGGTSVPKCLGDLNGNGHDDACDPKCEVNSGSPTGCTDVCLPPAPAGAQCLPSSYGCVGSGTCGVLACNCDCHLIFDAAGPTCQGSCPNGVDICPPTPQGNGSIGNPYRCECGPDPTGACCTTGAAGNTCINTTQSQCQGTFLPGVTCSGITVACCLPSGSCANMDEVCCSAAGGISLVGSVCTSNQACCFGNGTCQNLDPLCCTSQGGLPGGAGTFCLGDFNPQDGIDDACEVCEPKADGSGCKPVPCNGGPVQEECQKHCANYNPLTGQITVTDCDCRGVNACHLVTPAAGNVAAGSDPCIVTDNGGGTVTLPPAGCAYLSPDEVHKIINGLPAGTTFEFAAIHKDFICNRGSAGGACSFVPGVDCDEPGGSLGGEKECADSKLQLNMTGKCTGGVSNPLCGYNRLLNLPVSMETHVGPRTPGQPVQSFDTDMFRMQGQIGDSVGIGDPDFDLLRITAGTGFGMPSPGHTTLALMPGGGNWAVDSFFDIEYRIDFVGKGPRLGGMSGSTTGTIRMQTNPSAPFKCEGGCSSPKKVCVPKTKINTDGTLTVCCDCRPKKPIPDITSVNKSRFISFSLAGAATAMAGPDDTAIRVKLTSLHHVLPPYTDFASIPFTLFEGKSMWVGPPATYIESESDLTQFKASHLQCDPYYQDWSTVGLLHVTGEAIVPSSFYDVEVLGASCVGSEDTCADVSEALQIQTGRWGDAVLDFQDPTQAASQPDFDDIGALVNKFKSLLGAPIKTRAKLAGVDARGLMDITPDVGFDDIPLCVDAFKGRAYPYKPGKCTGAQTTACLTDTDCGGNGPCILCP